MALGTSILNDEFFQPAEDGGLSAETQPHGPPSRALVSNSGELTRRTCSFLIREMRLMITGLASLDCCDTQLSHSHV